MSSIGVFTEGDGVDYLGQINQLDGPFVSSHSSDEEPPVAQLANVPRLFRFDNAPPEATGLAMDVFARAFIIMAGIFLGPALLECATKAVEAQCLAEGFDDQDALDACIETGRVYGYKPSSLLSNIAIVSGILGSIAMPFFGALVDHTPYRWHVGAYSAFFLVLAKGAEAMVSLSTWFFVACLQVVSAILFNMHVTTTLAYTSELSEDPAKQAVYNTYFGMMLYLSTLLFLAFITVTAIIFTPGDDVATARISQVTTSSAAAILFYNCWKFFFRDRPALSSVPEGQFILTVGFRRVLNTCQSVVRELPQLKWFLISVMFAESASMTIPVIGTTFMKEFLEMDANQISIVFLCVLVMGAPGSKLGGIMSLRINSLNSAIVCNVLFIVSTAIGALTITGPQHKSTIGLIGALWGLAIGFQGPVNCTILMSIIPRGGQEAEFMGLYLLAGQSLSWLPPMVFTLLNEMGFGMNVGLLSLDIFFAFGIVGLLLMGEYDKALNGHISYTRQPLDEEISTTNETEMGLSSLEQPGHVIHRHSHVMATSLS